MPNKLKDIFSNRMFELGGNIHFKDAESCRKFSEAIDLLYETGIPTEVDGIDSISTYIRDGSSVYPPNTHGSISRVVISPSKEQIPLTIESPFGNKEVFLWRYQTKTNIIVETSEQSIVFLKLSIVKGSSKVNFTYRIQLNKANRIEDIADSLHDTLGILQVFFGPLDVHGTQDGNSDFVQMIKSFQFTSMFFDKLCAVENKLRITFNPSEVGDINKEAPDVYELYLLLVEKKPVRLNAKLTSTTSTGITVVDNDFEHKLGSSLALTFTGENTYTICGQNICIHTANLLTNAIIKEVITDKDGTTKILYGDTDSKPMYISYRGFTTKGAATKEHKKIIPNAKVYEDAPTVEKYIAECNNQFE